MAELKPLLVEIGCEELPPKALDELAQAFTRGLCDALEKRGIAVDTAAARTFNSPRRLGALIPDVGATQPDRASERRGPAVKAGLDAAGKPTRALLGFAASCSVDVAELEQLETDKGSWFVHRAVIKGQPTAALMQEIVGDALKALPIPKPMRWGDHDFAFVRPVHWIVIVHGNEAVDAEVFGVRSGRESRGHRFHHPQPVPIATAHDYLDALRDANVLADPAERRARVRAEVARAGDEAGGNPRLRDELLDEIANLTEWPVAIACTFDRAFLDIPPEALITTMETNQKFVPMFADGDRLSEHFVGVANVLSSHPAEIRRGYERVIRPRFADAKFFYDEDRKTPLADHQQALKSVTYQHQLGSVWDKCVRVAELSRVIANRCDIDAALTTRAAALCKCDLMTRMVGEFPELQGVMGRYYARAGGEPAEVAQALDAFYQPRFAGDAIAEGTIAQTLAIAERLDTLAGIFAVGLRPSGNKDPFALRRAALGLARTLIEGGFDLELEALLREAVELLPDIAAIDGAAPLPSKDTLTDDLTDFVYERLRSYYADQGFGADRFDAVRAVAPDTLLDFDRRLRAVDEFAQMPDAAALAAANKRIGNILRQADGAIGAAVDPEAFDVDAEAELHRQIQSTSEALAPMLAERRYLDVLRRLAQLRGPVDAFFDSVMVMADDERQRRNRLGLLSRLRRLFLDVADVSLLQHH